jgi:hypothetical protein
MCPAEVISHIVKGHSGDMMLDHAMGSFEVAAVLMRRRTHSRKTIPTSSIP